MPKRKVKAKEPTQVDIPDAVRKQGEKADALLEGDPEPTDVITDKIVDDKEPEPAPVTPAHEPAPVIKTPDPEPEPLSDDKTDWKHKYDVLQGMYNKGQTDLQSLSETVANLQAMVNQQSTLLQQPKIETAPAAAAPAIGIDKLNEDDFVGYGDEMKVMARNFNLLIDQNNQLMARLDGQGPAPVGGERLDRIESMVRDTAQDRYTRALDQQVPKWREIVNDATFTGWLQGVDPTSNYRFKDMMDSAYSNLNHMQVGAILKRYAADTGIDIGVVATAIPVAPGVTNIDDQTIVDPLARHAMPDETTGGDQGKVPEVYPTAEEVKTASALYAQGKLSYEKATEISNRFQMGLAAAKKAANA